MDRKERILSYMQSKEYIPLKINELMTVLDVPSDSEKELIEILEELLSEGRIYITKKGRYISVEDDKSIFSGVLKCNSKGFFGFVICDDNSHNDIYVAGENMGSALNGDRVIVKIDEVKKSNYHSEGHIIKVLERNNKLVVGVIKRERHDCFVVQPDNSQIFSEIKVSSENVENIRKGQRVCVKISEYEPLLKGEIISILGDRESVKGCVDGIIIESGIASDFLDETKEEIKYIAESVSQKETEGRLDLRDELIFTIDGRDARDFDDAVSLKILDNGHYYLGVHIADVTHYVKPGTALDNDAFSRGTSVYLADRVIPMLPKKLSNGICSLNPDVDRLTLSVFMEIDKHGNVTDNEIRESIIHSRERMTYEDVNAIFDGDKELIKKYAHLTGVLDKMSELAEILRNKRNARGSINFDFPETQIDVDEDSNPTDIYYAVRGISNKMIEEFMLVANETVAEYAFWMELPFVYRVHEAPSADKIIAFNKFISHFGYVIKGKFDDENSVHPKALQKVLDETKDTPEEQMIATSMLRSLMKADYRSENLGHFGLAAKYYCHFTSPIRRYPDLAIHRILKHYIHSDNKDMSEFVRFVSEASKHSSDTELRAIYAERDVEDVMKAAYMRDYIGYEFEAIISSVASFGMFATLENSVEGLIRCENISDDYYEYEEKTQSLTGRRTGKTYQVGDRVNVVLMRADIVSRQIDFVLSEDATSSMFNRFNNVAKKVSRKIKKDKNKRYRKR